MQDYGPFPSNNEIMKDSFMRPSSAISASVSMVANTYWFASLFHLSALIF